MTASCAPRWAPSPGRAEGPLGSWDFVGILLVALGLLLPTSSDACDDPPRFQSMMLKGNPQPPYVNGYKIEYKCRPGYKPIIPRLVTTAVCQADGTWTPLQDACRRKSCRNLGDPLNGRVSGSFQYGSQAHFSCNEGYFLIGAKNLYCELSGNNVDWSDVPPQCEKILCEPPKNILNGKYTSSHKDTFEYGEVVTYSCDPSGGPDPYSLIGESMLVCSGQNVWSSDPPECKVVKCPHPTVKNGQMVSGPGTKYYYKTKVVFKCLQGFSLKGSPEVICEANNAWEPEIPECVKVVIPPRTKPPSTKPTTSSVSEHPIPSDEPPPNNVEVWNSDRGLNVVIVLTILVGLALIGTCMYKFHLFRKRRLQEN